eukprot:TRINITY_DN13619_c0_g1_i1.p1 TRINITY_DN13619_c0_g1~~TRINITY_DN13619_c0_g1_i1.p1  ORF type:complete len:576 (+),score=84.06 TRINITY_DN13619_c0_g1_i1:101-1828(+)
MALAAHSRHIIFIFTSVQLVHSNFLGANETARSRVGHHRVSSDEVAMSLQESFEHVLGMHGHADSRRILHIEKNIWQTVQALPKNAVGRLPPRSVRYVVHSYFAKEHGWLLSGLEPHALQANSSDLHGASILQDQAPQLVETLLEDRQRGRGLLLEDVVTMIAALENLIFRESVALLEAAYALNGLQPDVDVLSELGAHEVLRSYLVLFRMGSSADLEDNEWHADLKEQMEDTPSGFWHELVEYEQDALLNAAFARRHTENPFQSIGYSFEAISEIVRELAHSYGKWQNGDCLAMKEHLMSLDPNGSGRVPLDRFYSQLEGAAYNFAESVDYLRAIGALEESVGGSGGGNSVRIANYVAGPTNCIAHSAYYSVCCLNECESLMSELEGRVQAPSASADQILRLARQLSSSTVEAPRQISTELEARLQQVSEHHGGIVPLHGRLFSQWLHFVFPNECPYPQTVSTAALTPGHWLNQTATVSEEDRESHLESAFASEMDLEPALAYWSDDEVLLLYDDMPVLSWHATRNHALGLLHTCARLAPLLIVLRSARGAWQAAVGAHRGTGLHVKAELGHFV